MSPKHLIPLTTSFCFQNSNTLFLAFLGSAPTSLNDHRLLGYLMLILLLAFLCLVFHRVLSLTHSLLYFHKLIPWHPSSWLNCPFRWWYNHLHMLAKILSFWMFYLQTVWTWNTWMSNNGLKLNASKPKCMLRSSSIHRDREILHHPLTSSYVDVGPSK